MKRIICTIFLLTLFLNIFAQWTKINDSTINANYRCVYFLDDSIGFVGGLGPLNSTLLRTADGGATWDQLTLNTVFNIRSIYFINHDTGFVLGYNNDVFLTELNRTVDGGNTWNFVSYFWAYDGEIKFINDSVGFLGLSDGGDGYIYKTIDYGITWDTIVIPGCALINSIDFPTDSIGYFVTHLGKIGKTNDCGQTWTVTQPTSHILMDVEFVSADTGWVVGEIILKTTNSGQNWQLQTAGGMAFANAIANLNDQTAFIDGIYTTCNGGISWLPDTILPPVREFSFPSINIGYAVTDEGIWKRTNLITGIAIGKNATDKITIYPNPAKDFINIVDKRLINNKYYLSINNIQGQFILRENITFNTNYTLDLSNINDGIYFLTLQNDKENYVCKIVIQN